MRITFLIAAVTATTLTLSGCVGISPRGHARNILVEKGSGIVAMPVTENGSEERANREKAVQLIEAKCGKAYEITREEEVDVGVIEDLVMNNAASGPSTKKLVKSRKAEYRLWYRCQ